MATDTRPKLTGKDNTGSRAAFDRSWQSVHAACKSAVRAGLMAVLGIALAVGGSTAWCSGSGAQEVQLPQSTPEMHTYSYIRYAMYFIYILYGGGVLFAAVASGFSARLRTFAERKTENPVLQFLLFYSALFTLLGLINFPLNILSGFALEHYFHLTRQSLSSWFTDQLKEFLLALLLSLPVTGGFFLLVRKFPRVWPILFWLVTSGVIVFETFISPIVLEPVMNRFTPMPAGRLRDQISTLATTAGAPGAPIYVANKSKQTDKINAYVSGLGPSTHIVIWDTTLAKLPDDEVLAIVGHELGHYYLKHACWDCLLAILAGIALIPINACLARPVVGRLPKSWQIRGLDDFAVLPALALLAIIGGFLMDPILNAWSRLQEHQADAFSLSVTRNGPALARTFVSLSKQNLSEPDPPAFIEFWLFSHPSLRKRINFVLGKTE